MIVFSWLAGGCSAAAPPEEEVDWSDPTVQAMQQAIEELRASREDPSRFVRSVATRNGEPYMADLLGQPLHPGALPACRTAWKPGEGTPATIWWSVPPGAPISPRPRRSSPDPTRPSASFGSMSS
jgi:hypothetical protein